MIILSQIILLACLAVVSFGSAAADATVWGQIILGTVVALQIYLQTQQRKQDRFDREQQRRYDEEDRRRRAEELEKKAEAVASKAEEMKRELKGEIERNTEITVKGFQETNNHIEREKEMVAAFTKLVAIPAERDRMDKLQEMKATGEDTNQRARDIEEDVSEVAKTVTRKDS